jgi:hypothetical protein
MTRFVTREQAAEMLACKSSYLANLKSQRRGPRAYKWGSADRSPCRYDPADVIAWAKDPVAHEREVWGKKAATSKRKTRRT